MPSNIIIISQIGWDRLSNSCLGKKQNVQNYSISSKKPYIIRFFSFLFQENN